MCSCTISFTDGKTLEIKDIKEISYDLDKSGALGQKVIPESDLLTTCIPLNTRLWFRAENKVEKWNVCVNCDGVRCVELVGPPF